MGGGEKIECGFLYRGVQVKGEEEGVLLSSGHDKSACYLHSKTIRSAYLTCANVACLESLALLAKVHWQVVSQDIVHDTKKRKNYLILA